MSRKSVKLIVFDGGGEKFEYVQSMLLLLSEGYVRRSGEYNEKLYAYFDSVEKAQIAAGAAVHMMSCGTKIRRGNFEIEPALTIHDRNTSGIIQTRIVRQAIEDLGRLSSDSIP